MNVDWLGYLANLVLAKAIGRGLIHVEVDVCLKYRMLKLNFRQTSKYIVDIPMGVLFTGKRVCNFNLEIYIFLLDSRDWSLT